MSQRSILSFFGPKSNKKLDSSHSSSSEGAVNNDLNESPLKQKSQHNRKSRTIESDSEEELLCSGKSEINSEDSPASCSDAVASTSHAENSAMEIDEDLPPLRKTARKQIKRKSGCLEDQQVEMIKKIKSNDNEKDGRNKENIDEDDTATKKKEKDSHKSKSNRALTDANMKKTRNPEGYKTILDKFRKSPAKDENNQSNITEKLSPKSSSLLSNKDKSPTKSVTVKSSNKDKSPVKSSNKDKLPVKSFNKDKSPVKSSNKDKSPVKSSSNTGKSPNKSSPEKSSNKDISPSKISPNKGKSPTKSSTKNKSPGKNSPNKGKSPVKSSNKEESPVKSSNSGQSPSKSSPNKSPVKNSPDKSSPNKDKSSNKEEPKKVSSFFALKTTSGISDSFNPAKKKYDPIEDASWKRNEKVPFVALARTFEIIEDTSGRLKIIEILSNFLRSVSILSPEDLKACLYLCLNTVAPAFEGIELRVGEIFLCRALAQATGRSVNKIKGDIAEKGDLGIVAEQSKSNQKMMFQPARLTIQKLFQNTKEIALMSGHESQNKKIDKIKTMLVACKGIEAKFLVRILSGKLRIGLAEQSVLQALAQACYLTPPEQEYPPKVLNAGKGLSAESLKNKIDEHSLVLKTTYCECPSFDEIIPVLLEHGLMELPEYCKLKPGIPLKPMLAHPTKGVSEVLKRFENAKFTCEYKYDGERAQIHMKSDGTINIFSRNQENNTSKYPDIISRFKNSVGKDVESCIIDSEAVAYDIKEDRILPFQVLSTRKRKDVDESDITVQVCVFPFDLLYLNGENLVKKPLEYRRNLLKENFIEIDRQFSFVTSMDSTNTEDIEEFLEESIKGNCEGLMVKSLDIDATYEIAKRSHNWLKLKKDYLQGVGDTIDVVVIGGFLGKGKRVGTYGGFLLACYDSENEEFQSLCKIGTGFTDEMLEKHTEFFKEHIISEPKSYYRYDSSVTPDHWFDAVQVWEIKCADLSISPVHKAAIGEVDSEKGISLRFPRFLKIREDKSPEDATSASQIAELYRSQDQIKNQISSDKPEDEDY